MRYVASGRNELKKPACCGGLFLHGVAHRKRNGQIECAFALIFLFEHDVFRKPVSSFGIML